MEDSEPQCPDSDPRIDSLCDTLAAQAPGLEGESGWPARQLQDCAEAGVFRWFLPHEWGGWDWNERSIAEGYLRLSSSCLTTTFVITQRTGACKRISASENQSLKDELLPDLAAGKSFATVGISHLSTSRRHLGKPALRATAADGGFVLDGYSAWVTGAPFAQHIVLGAELEDGRQVLMAVPTDLDGIHCEPTPELLALSASRTGKVTCDRLFVDERYLVAGPIENVMQHGPGASTGGTQTSTLAIGLADAAIRFMEEEAVRRPELSEPTEALRTDWKQLVDLLLAIGEDPLAGSKQELRQRSNSLVVRAAQSSLTAAKGAGFVHGHPTGRWCREALFFLVWSCPYEVVNANLCEFAGLADG